MYICEYFVFCTKWVKNDIVVVGLLMNSWLIDVVVVMRYWWFMLWVFIIMELWWDLSCFWKFYEKWVNQWFVLKWCLISSLMCFWKPFCVHKPINNLWERIWMLEDQNLGFFGEKWFELERNCAEQMSGRSSVREASSKRAVSRTWTLERAGPHLSERTLLQHTLFCISGFGGRSELSKMLLSTCLITVFTL